MLTQRHAARIPFIDPAVAARIGSIQQVTGEQGAGLFAERHCAWARGNPCTPRECQEVLRITVDEAGVKLQRAIFQTDAVGSRPTGHGVQPLPEPITELAETMWRVVGFVIFRPQCLHRLVERDAFGWLTGQVQQEFPGLRLAAGPLRPHLLTCALHARWAEAEHLDRRCHRRGRRKVLLRPDRF